MEYLPKRKRNRIENYDYSQPAAYLITICTKNHAHLFGTVDARVNPPCTILSPLGQMVSQAVSGIDVHYANATVDAYSIMPNHIHLLLRLRASDTANPPSVSRIIKQFKEHVTKDYGENIWQKGFHDHVVRTEDDYQLAWNYVAYNPSKWVEKGNHAIK